MAADDRTFAQSDYRRVVQPTPWRIGFPNPTLRTGAIDEPWNLKCTDDAVRRFAICIGDDNPLFTNPEYAARTRWSGVIAPPAFEKSMGINRNPVMDPDDAKVTSKALVACSCSTRAARTSDSMHRSPRGRRSTGRDTSRRWRTSHRDSPYAP
ncbi:FAS1-like dehydratase domain-containing protein [Sphingomonas sp. MMS24-JH45]